MKKLFIACLALILIMPASAFFESENQDILIIKSGSGAASAESPLINESSGIPKGNVKASLTIEENGNTRVILGDETNENAPLIVRTSNGNLYWTARFFVDAYSTLNPVFDYHGYNTGKFAMGTATAKDWCSYTNSYANERWCFDGDAGTTATGAFYPASDNTYDLGSAGRRVHDAFIVNVKSTRVDATTLNATGNAYADKYCLNPSCSSYLALESDGYVTLT